MAKKKVMTVCGPISPDALGVTLCHMHTTTDISNWYTQHRASSGAWIKDAKVNIGILGRLRIDPLSCRDNLVIDDLEMVIQELRELKMAGCSTIVDTCPTTLLPTRDPLGQKKMSLASGINIICASGWYVAPAHPSYIREKTLEDLCTIVVEELTQGCRYTWGTGYGYPVDAGGIKAGIIKVGVGGGFKAFNNEDEKKCFLACCRAQVKTGRPFCVHPNGHEQLVYNPKLITYIKDKPLRESSLHQYLDIMKSEGVDFDRFYMNHSDCYTCNIDLLRSLLDRGIGLSFDGFNDETYLIGLGFGINYDNRQRMEVLSQLIKEGYASQLLPSCECYMKIMYKKYGGYGYTHLLETIIPVLKNAYGVSQKAIDAMLIENPKKYLSYDD
ncbi:MAG: phosphotriesterase [Deltaproteobacteria bacterium]|nr:phosphotriesterase [Deltaproteobacteria bacterium]